MKQYFALSSDDFPFLQKAAIPDSQRPTERLHFKKLKNAGCFLPQECSLLHPATALWYKKYAAAEALERKPRTAEQILERGLLRHFTPTHTFIPLNYAPAHVLAFSHFPYIFPDAFLPSNEAIVRQSRQCENMITACMKLEPADMGWSHPWPVYHAHYLRWIFDPVLIAAAIGQHIKEEGGKLTFCLNEGERYTAHLAPFALFAAVWKHFLGDALHLITYDDPQEYSPYPEGLVDYAPLHGSLLFSCVASTMERFLPVGLLSKESSRKPVIFGTYGRSYNPAGVAQAYAQEVQHHGMRFLPLPAPDHGDAGAIQAATDHLVRVLDQHMPYGPESLELTSRFLATFFWRTENAYQKLVKVFASHRPALCLGEVNNGCEPALALLAARETGIPTVGLPHAYLLSAGGNTRIVPAHRYAMPHRLSTMQLTRHEPEARVQSFRQLVLDNEYFPDEGNGLKRTEEKLNVLVLFTAHLISSPLFFPCYARLMEEWLTQMVQMPRTLQGSVAMRYKMHPRFHNYALLKTYGIAAADMLPPESSMDEALAHADLAISCEYGGAPFFHACRAGVPAVLCLSRAWLEMHKPFADLIEFIQPRYLCTEPAHFWRDMVPLLCNEHKRRQLVEEQTAFARHWLAAASSDWGGWLGAPLSD